MKIEFHKELVVKAVLLSLLVVIGYEIVTIIVMYLVPSGSRFNAITNTALLLFKTLGVIVHLFSHLFRQMFYNSLHGSISFFGHSVGYLRIVDVIGWLVVFYFVLCWKAKKRSN